MNRLGKTIELIVKLENTHDEETREDQRKIRDQLETRGLEVARDHEMLELEGIPEHRRLPPEDRTGAHLPSMQGMRGGDGPPPEQESRRR